MKFMIFGEFLNRVGTLFTLIVTAFSLKQLLLKTFYSIKFKCSIIEQFSKIAVKQKGLANHCSENCWPFIWSQRILIFFNLGS